MLEFTESHASGTSVFSLTLPPKKTHSPSRGQRGCPVKKKSVLADVDVPWLKWIRLKQVKIQHLTNCNTYHTDYTSPRMACWVPSIPFFWVPKCSSFQTLWRVFMKVSVGKCWVVKSS